MSTDFAQSQSPMNEDNQAIFIAAVRADDSIPAAVREKAMTVEGLERRTFDLSYFSFLGQQIISEPRGPEWTAVLKKRLAALAPYCGRETIFGGIPTPAGFWFIDVDPESKRVIHREAP